MSDDVVSRAKAALEARCCSCGYDRCGWHEMEFAAECRGDEDNQGLVPELIAELEQLREWNDNQANTIKLAALKLQEQREEIERLQFRANVPGAREDES
jgi:hypothetical protein